MVSAANPALGRQVALPVHELPDDPAPPDGAYQLIHDELMLDGNARLNLATFVTTWMEPRATLLMAERATKNMIDNDLGGNVQVCWDICNHREVEPRMAPVEGGRFHLSAEEAVARSDLPELAAQFGPQHAPETASAFHH